VHVVLNDDDAPIGLRFHETLADALSDADPHPVWSISRRPRTWTRSIASSRVSSSTPAR
jgi:hypothetical protein